MKLLSINFVSYFRDLILSHSIFFDKFTEINESTLNNFNDVKSHRFVCCQRIEVDSQDGLRLFSMMAYRSCLR